MKNWRRILLEEWEKGLYVSPADFVNNYGDLISAPNRDAKKKRVTRQIENFKSGKMFLQDTPEDIPLSDLKNLEENSFSYTGDCMNKEVIETNFKSGVITKDKVIEILPEEINDPNVLLRAHGFDPHKFELIGARNSRWEQNSKHDGKTVLYASRINVRPFISFENCIDEISEYFKDYKSSITKSTYKIIKDSKNSKDYLVLPLYDFHWGRLPDLENAETFSLLDMKKVLLDNMKEYINRFQNRHFKKVYLVIGQDYFNSSFTGFTSSQSHLQSNAVDTHTMYRTGTELMIDIIEMFLDRGDPVEVVGSLGNHSKEEEAWLFALISAYYRNTPSVTVDDGHKPRKYLDLGSSCIGLGHLDKEGKRIFGLMQVEAPDLWAKATTRMFIAGHLHHFKVENEMGVEVWRIPSATLPDRWTVENGYVLTLPKTMAFVFNEDTGLVENHFVRI